MTLQAGAMDFAHRDQINALDTAAIEGQAPVLFSGSSDGTSERPHI